MLVQVVAIVIIAVILGYLSQVHLRLLNDAESSISPSQSAITAFYDRFGPLLMNDFYHHAFESAAMDSMISLCDIQAGDRIVEIGPGTGFLASKILKRLLQTTTDNNVSTYYGIEVSRSMHETAKRNLQDFLNSSHVEINLQLVDNSTEAVRTMHGSVDKVILTYVMDLLPEYALQQLILQLHDKLESDRSRRNSKICVVNLTYGIDSFSRLLTNIWQLAYITFGGAVVGGCRPLQIEKYFNEDNGFQINTIHKIVSNGLPSEVAIIHKL